MKKRILSLALALALCLGLIPAAAAIEPTLLTQAEERGLLTYTDAVDDWDGYLTRLQAAELLAALARLPLEVPGTDFAFTDCEGLTANQKAVVQTVTKARVMLGVSAEEFAHQDNMTREQMAVMIYRAMHSTGSDPTVEGADSALQAFTDAGAVSAWAYEAVATLCALQIIPSSSSGKLHPGANITGSDALGWVIAADEYIWPSAVDPEPDDSGWNVTELAACVYDDPNMIYFLGGLAVVKRNGKYGAIDRTGREVIPCKYEDAYNVAEYDDSEGLIAVVQDDKYGFIDKTGQVVIPFQYECYHNGWAPYFSDGLASVAVGSWPDDQLWGFIDKTGKEVIPCTLDCDPGPSFVEGYARLTDGYHCAWLIDKTGKEVVPRGRYSDIAGEFTEGMMSVWQGDKCGFIDETGKEVIPCLYDNVWNEDFSVPPMFHEGLAAVCLNGKYGFIDKTGQVVIPFEYDYGYDFFGGLANVRLNGQEITIDKTGQVVAPGKYDTISHFWEGLAVVSLNGKYGFIDATGQEVVPCRYESAQTSYDGLAAVKLNGKWGYVDKTGKEVIPCTLAYASVEPFLSGFAKVRDSNGRYGLIDRTGREVVPCGRYDSTGPWTKRPWSKNGPGLVEVRDSNGQEGLIDQTGREIVPCGQYDDVSVCEDGLVVVKRDGKCGLLSITRKDAPSVEPVSGQMEGTDGSSVTYAISQLGQLTVAGDLARDELVMAAMYDGQGRLTGVEVLTADKLTTWLDTAAAKVKLFWLGGSSTPLSTAATLWERP